MTKLKKTCCRVMVGAMFGSLATIGSVAGVAHAATINDGPPAAPAPVPGVPMPNPNPYEIPIPVPAPGGGA